VNDLDDLVVCRCEGVRWAEVVEARATFGLTSLRALKLATRMGMGICQGRVCRPIADALAASWNLESEGSQLPVRPPVRPASFATLAGQTEDG
jgi:bacterioferritin-associated ferredoxin